MEGLSECAASGAPALSRTGVHRDRPRAPNCAHANLPTAEAEELFCRVITGKADAKQQELFRAQMLTEMARMSVEDGLVMQIPSGQRAQPQSQALRAIWP